MYRIFVVEDDARIAKLVKQHLEKWEYQVQCVSDFNRVMEEFREFQPELVIMDIILPLYNGYHWCAEIRKESKVPILFLSSASENMNIVMAVNMGGDDFVAKPFDLDVLTVKIQALLRRSYDFAEKSSVLEFRGAELNMSGGTLTANGQKLELTRNEIKMLQTLLENRGKIVTREELMVKLWESDAYVDENTLSVNINRLRKKLDSVGLPEVILTKKGIGYRME